MKDYIEIDRDNELYPRKLKEIDNPPKKLYMRGNLGLINETSIAIVGSRDYTSYGFASAYKFAKELSKEGVCIISGLAEGIDTSAHLGAMHQRGKTMAILGAGLNRIYPEENEGLANSIIKNDGLIISEYSLEEEKKPQNFPKRNRIMSGLSCGVLIIEAKNRSGTLITARLAKEQSKKIFCIPANIDISNSSGTNELIKHDAKLVTCAGDILEEIKFRSDENKEEIKVDSEYVGVYNILTNQPMHINQICKKANISMGEANHIITMLEIEGLIKSLPNQTALAAFFLSFSLLLSHQLPL